MALADFLKQLDELAAQAVQAFGSATDAEAVEAARVEFLGAKQGRLKAAQKGMGEIDKTDRPAAGKRFNEIKEQIDAALKSAADRSALAMFCSTCAIVVIPLSTSDTAGWFQSHWSAQSAAERRREAVSQIACTGSGIRASAT